MRIHIIACRIFSRELSYLASQSENQIDITWVARGLHNTPQELSRYLQATVEGIHEQVEKGILENKPDAIVLGYGLCANGVVGIRCRDIPIVVPRTDDCIALFLGSQKRYMEEFGRAGGACWLNSGWIEHSLQLFDSEDIRRRKWQEYAEKFGEDNADYLIEMESGWISHYSTLGYIHSSVYDPAAYRNRAQSEAESHGWQLKEMQDDLRLLKMMVEGNWNDEEFLILKSGECIAADYTGKKLKAKA